MKSIADTKAKTKLPMPFTASATTTGLPRFMRSSVLAGPFAGKADVQGIMPAWLRGHLIRTATAVSETDSWRADHWFDALGMLYSFDIDAHGDVHWQQRLLECEFNKSILADGRTELGSFGTRNRRSFLNRLFHPTPRSTDNANVNIVPNGKHWVAMTETHRQLAIDPDTLKTKAELHVSDGLPPELLPTAHPHYDSERKEAINIGIHYGARSCLVVFAQAQGAQSRREIGRVPLKRVPYIHSFSITQTKIILVLPPYDLNPAGLLWSKRPISEHYTWSPDKGTRIVVMDRASGEYTEHVGPAFFFFHTVNAFDRADGSITLELLAFDDATILSDIFKMSNMQPEGLPTLTPKLHRITITPQKHEFDMTTVTAQAGFEFPRINYTRVNGKQHRYVWGSDFSSLVKVDTTTDTILRRSLDAVTLGEPIFVARPRTNSEDVVAEDDGVLLTVGTCDTKPGSELTIWDAQSLEVLVRITIPVAIPMGFHGNFERR